MALPVKHSGLLSVQAISSGEILPSTFKKVLAQVYLLLVSNQMNLLYLPTEIRFLIGGERVTCYWSNLSNALGRAKLSNAIGQQYLELSTCT